jgi:hypothetical protein
MSNAQIVTQLLIVAIQNADALSRLLARAQGEGRDVTKEELDALTATDAAARQRLQDAIAVAPGA